MTPKLIQDLGPRGALFRIDLKADTTAALRQLGIFRQFDNGTMYLGLYGFSYWVTNENPDDHRFAQAALKTALSKIPRKRRWLLSLIS